MANALVSGSGKSRAFYQHWLQTDAMFGRLCIQNLDCAPCNGNFEGHVLGVVTIFSYARYMETEARHEPICSGCISDGRTSHLKKRSFRLLKLEVCFNVPWYHYAATEMSEPKYAPIYLLPHTINRLLYYSLYQIGHPYALTRNAASFEILANALTSRQLTMAVCEYGSDIIPRWKNSSCKSSRTCHTRYCEIQELYVCCA